MPVGPISPVRAGRPWPLGVERVEAEQALNFALFSRHATGVTLLCYTERDPVRPVFELALQFPAHKTGSIWHCRVPEAALRGATLYAWRVDGPAEAQDGNRFDRRKVLLDPFAPAVFFPPGFDRAACAADGPTDGKAPLGRLPSQAPALPPLPKGPRYTCRDAIVYELHVKGLTANPNSGVAPERRGTFAGLIDKIPYLCDLGVTVVELLPVHQFDPQEGNYWGYMTLHFFSPHQQYARTDAFSEFRAMVDAFHRAGIEVWLDVVYNHTAEGGADGPTYSFRGIDNQSYYLLAKDGSGYVNDTGCGNTVRTGHPAGRVLVLESLRFWAGTMGIDGFRFDLASIFSRAADGTMGVHEASLVAEIGLLARLFEVRLVAEAWDISAYQLGQAFPGMAWLQWNGRFRDDVRSFVRGGGGKVADLMQRVYGSDDLFPDTMLETRRPHQSVNFVTAHDGFCLYDLVAYDRKHNEANGHDNRDGTDDNRSWNCGHEGDDGAPDGVLALRRQQAKNFAALLLLSNGIPMLVAGDEFLHTQRGNNNPYNQDNETTWLDWERLERNRDVFRFFKTMIAFRKAHPSIGRPVFWRDSVHWFGSDGPVDLGPESRHLAWFLDGASVGDDDLYVMVNGHGEDRAFTVQQGAAPDWRRVVDTALPSPLDICEPGAEPPLESTAYRVGAHSVVVLRRQRR
ncbi:MAG: glycogen-debranching protein [Planctomycetes bacterium]|nr:glycogen-debranching protein [Planctomycetota bacterium]